MKSQRALILITLIVVLIFPAKVLAAPFYDGKTITIFCGMRAGGGYDYFARLLAKYMPKYIPGSPSIVVQNMAGAGGMIAANYLSNQAKPDGLTFVTTDRGVIVSQMLKEKGVQFDATKWAWVGSLASEQTVLLVRTDLPYKTFDDLLKADKPIYIGDIGTGNYQRMYAKILAEHTGVNFKNITYPGGTRDMTLAVENKELDCLYVAYSAWVKYIERGVLLPVLRGRNTIPEIDKLPVNEDLVKDEKAKTIMKIYAGIDQIGKPFMAPANTPDNLMQILRGAFKKAAEDPEMRAVAEKVGRPITYTSGEQAAEIVNFVITQPQETVKEFLKYYNM